MVERTLQLRTTLEPRGPAAAVVLTDAQVEELGGGAKAPVTVTVDGRTTRVRLGRMGGENLVGLSKAARAELGVEIGQDVDVVVALDAQPREVELPPALVEALAADPAARTAFEALAPSRRKEHARSIAEAKQDATRERRLAALLDGLRG